MRRHKLIPFLVVMLALEALPPRLCQAQWQVDGVPVCKAANDQADPTILPDGAGGAIITWQDFRSGTSYDIYAQRLDAAGVPQWGEDGVPLCVADEDQEYPTITSDGAGGAIITWQDERTGMGDIYAQRVSPAGVPLWPADGVALCTNALAQVHPTIVSDGVGGAIVAWEDYRRDSGAGVFTQRVNAAGVPQWTPDGVGLTTTGAVCRYPQIVTDGAEGAIITWEDAPGSTSWDIYARRVNAAGVPMWTPNGVALSTAPFDQYYQTTISDGAGGAIVTWEDGRVGNSWDIYAQRVDAEGTPQWGSDGAPVCTATGAQEYPTIASDGAGGAIITWYDYRAWNSDIYAQRVIGGASQWTPDGVALCAAPRAQEYPAIVSDGTGGAIVAWYDLRDPSLDIYARRVSAAGAPQWNGDGVGLCTAAGGQVSPRLVSDGAGGAIVTWKDSRSGNADIYAQRIYGGGALAVDLYQRAPARFQLLPPSPNPARDGQLTIRFDLPSAGRVSAQVLDLAGHRVRTLATEREYSSGTHVLGWNGKSDAGVRLPSGVYFIEVRVGTHSEARRAILFR